MIGGPNETHVVLWCERERREAAPVYVALANVINNDTTGVPTTEDEAAEFMDNGRNTGGKV